MLDDLKYIHQRDTHDTLGTVSKQWQQLLYHYDVKWLPSGKFESIVVAGMGGSALAASLLETWPKTQIPLVVVRNYDLPLWINGKTLVVASSYSGNTEESLAALGQAEKLNCQIVVIASGGKLAERAKEKGYPLFLVPSGLQPRMAVFYNLAALIQILEPLGVTDSGLVAELERVGTWLGKQTDSWLPQVPQQANQAKKIATELIGKSVVIYGGPLMYPAAYKWKINFNENAKQIAWTDQLPEFNHNEFMGWTKQPVDKPYAVIDLRSNLEHPRVQKRFKVTEKLLSGLRPTPIVIEPEGDSALAQLLWVIALGDFVSLYVALLNNLDPFPVDLIERFKQDLDK